MAELMKERWPGGYSKDDLEPLPRGKFPNLERFAFNNVGTGKVFKLREVIAAFEPVHFNLYMVGVCGRRIKVKLRSWTFPDGEVRVGIEFVEVVNWDDE
ncbi:MAG: hypothetical protein ACFFB7_05935 [Candidatus Sifarchaeia archaeon]